MIFYTKENFVISFGPWNNLWISSWFWEDGSVKEIRLKQQLIFHQISITVQWNLKSNPHSKFIKFSFNINPHKMDLKFTFNSLQTHFKSNFESNLCPIHFKIHSNPIWISSWSSVQTEIDSTQEFCLKFGWDDINVWIFEWISNK